DRPDRSFTPISGEGGLQQFAKFSPDGTRVGFVRDNDLWVVDLETREEVRLTEDGSDTVINGTFDWVYEEELGLQDGWRWSPDGARIAFWRIDEAPVQTFRYDLTYADLYPDVESVPYPKAGQPNPRARIGVVEVDGGEITWIDTGREPDVYLARMEWAGGPDQVVIQRLNRHQNRLDILLADVETGGSRVLLTEASDTWVDVDDHFRWVGGGERFVWSSERDGFNHLYLYARDGELVRRLTEGEWVVSTPVGVDEAGGWVYFTGHRESPLQTSLYRVSVGGGPVERVTPEDGSHSVEMNPQATVFLDEHSRAGSPPSMSLRDGGGEVIRRLVENRELARKLDDLGLRKPEFFTFTTSDGVELDGAMIRPPDFDPSRRHPALLYVYGGPGTREVTDGWNGLLYLWHQLMAERGYIVAVVDGRGSGGRGTAFKNVTYLDLGRWESHDQVEAARYLGSLEYVDASRIGIWGSSYGAYLTLLAMMKGGDVFRAGIARAPVTHWKFYDTIYTERYMRTPRENPEGYRRSAPLNHVDGLTGTLLLFHGTGDDNVHFQNSVQMVRALQEAGKQFDFMLYPGKTHAIRGLESNLHLYRMMTDFLLEHL
ncbi:MAG: prolyl oligopeptidase family serine peptidase, partial [Gemmatimonadetes bacterium]|nr:S9 family peptidase [Gemmatimonadota bacterium]NIR80394.1 S9 family peptidase [Gemmatimonadota bacterium]NIT89154.1 S9 family peptidase [Gemmatimonadota bacterium]NIU32954.1 S9 family peptidase [Gemmatimonadota bacterium]NIU37346.1 prolyl oligopeptidase family serine peptidase [Gemmatimonadota bacterium]